MDNKFCDDCAEHLVHREQISSINKKFDEIKDVISKLAEYLPKIDHALNQVINIQESLRESARTSKDLYQKIDMLTSTVNSQALQLKEHDIFIKNSAEDKKDLKNIYRSILVGIGVTGVCSFGAFMLYLYKTVG